MLGIAKSGSERSAPIFAGSDNGPCLSLGAERAQRWPIQAGQLVEIRDLELLLLLVHRSGSPMFQLDGYARISVSRQRSSSVSLVCM